MDRAFALNDCCRSFAFLFLGIVKFLENGTVEPYLPFISTLIRSSFLWNKNHSLIKRHIGQTAAKCYFHWIFTPWWGKFEQRCLFCTFWSPDFFGVPKNARRFRLCALAQERRNRHLRCLSTDGESQCSLVGRTSGGFGAGAYCLVEAEFWTKTIGPSDENGEGWRKRLQKSSVYWFQAFQIFEHYVGTWS